MLGTMEGRSVAKKKTAGGSDSPERRKPGRPPSGKPRLAGGYANPRFVFSLTEAVKEKLRIVAEKNGRTMSQEVAYAVRQHIARELGEPS